MSITFEEAKRMSPADRAALIARTCTLLDQNDTKALWEKLETLTCAHGTCDHYTCTEGAALVEWEHYERLAGR